MSVAFGYQSHVRTASPPFGVAVRLDPAGYLVGRGRVGLLLDRGGVDELADGLLQVGPSLPHDGHPRPVMVSSASFSISARALSMAFRSGAVIRSRLRAARRLVMRCRVFSVASL